MNAKEIIEWVEAQPNISLNEKSISEFVKNLQNKILELDFTLPDGKIALGYAGSLGKSSGNTGIFRTIDVITADGKYAFINDVGDNILNYKYINPAGEKLTLREAIAQKTNPIIANRIVNGEILASGNRLVECYPGTMCLNGLKMSFHRIIIRNITHLRNEYKWQCRLVH